MPDDCFLRCGSSGEQICFQHCYFCLLLTSESPSICHGCLEACTTSHLEQRLVLFVSSLFAASAQGVTQMQNMRIYKTKCEVAEVIQVLYACKWRANDATKVWEKNVWLLRIATADGRCTWRLQQRKQLILVILDGFCCSIAYIILDYLESAQTKFSMHFNVPFPGVAAWLADNLSSCTCFTSCYCCTSIHLHTQE